MNFVYDENLVAVARGRDRYGVDNDLAHIINSGVGRGVYLHHVYRARRRDFNTGSALAARLGRDSGYAVETFGKYSGRGRLSNAARAGEQIGVMNAAVRYRILERASDGLLPYDLLKALGPEFSC
jgi:hypothetical protein